MHSPLYYQIALTLVPNIGPVQAKILLHQIDPVSIFTTSRHLLEKIEGIGSIRANSIKSFNDFELVEKELKFIEQFNIKPLFITDADYPQRLLNCYDAPAMLYYRGNANLNASKIVAIVGSRSHTDYGRQLTEKLVNELSEQSVLIISGLAYGIDALAHKAALKNMLPKVGVLAHGLDQIYPYEHAALAKDMINEGGGLLTEFRHESKPDKHNFPTRNRIVAGISDAVIVIETGNKGGSMITAELANGYNKDVFAFPGKTTDLKSAGCNDLIRKNKAILITGSDQLLKEMGWDNRQVVKKKQKEIFIQLTSEEQIILSLLETNTAMHIDELNLKSGLSTSHVAGALLNLELENVVVSLPGKQYQLI